MKKFDYVAAATLVRNKDDRMRQFAVDAHWLHNDYANLMQTISEFKRELALREAEIVTLKECVMKLEERDES